MEKKRMFLKAVGKKTFLLTASLGLTILFLLQSCLKDNFEFDKIAETNWNPEFAIPLVHSKLTIQDILYNTDDDGYFEYGADNFVTLVYQGNVLSSSDFSGIVPLPNQFANSTFGLSGAEAASFPVSGTITKSISTTVAFGAGPSQEIDSIGLNAGSLAVQLNSDFRHSGNIKITFPTTKKNGSPFVANIPFTYSGSVPVLVNTSFDLTGYTMDLTNPSFNQLPIDYEMTLNYSGQPVTTSDQLDLDLTLSGLQFEKIFGFFGSNIIIPVTEDTSRIKIFDNIVSGNLRFEEPKITFIINNSFGIPVEAHFNTIYAHSIKNNVDVNITGIPNPLPVNFPSYSQVGQSISTSVIIDKNNSNIKDVIDTVPKYIAFLLDAVANPSSQPQVRNFITNQSKFRVDVDVEMPLYGTARDVVFQDTLAFNLDTSISELEEATFRIYSNNGFPIDAMVQVYFFYDDSVNNSNDKYIDSLITPYQQFISAGQLDANDKVVAPTAKTIDVTIDKARLEKLSQANTILVWGEVETPNNGQQNVRIYSDYILEVKLGIKAKFNVAVNVN